MNKEKFLINLELIKNEEKVEKQLLGKIENFKNEEKEKILEAMEFCKEKHFWQTRDEWTPYFSHPFFVAILWIENNLNYLDIISLLLHDTLEDTKTTKEEIKEKFWDYVLENVYFLSKNFFATKEEYYKNISKTQKLQLLKWLDRLANLHSLKFASEEKQKNYIEKTKKEILSILNQDLKVTKDIKEVLWFY